MLLRSICSRMVLLTQFYPHCAFETPNLQYYLHLSIFMFFRAMFTHVASDAILSSLCIWNPKSAKLFSFKHMHAPQRNVFTHGASDAILSSVCFSNPDLENYFHLSIFMLLGQCVHTLCFWYTLKPPIWIFLHLSIFILLRAMCSHMVLLTQFYHHSAFQTPNQEYSGYLSIFMLRKAMCAHMALLTKNILSMHWKPKICIFFI